MRRWLLLAVLSAAAAIFLISTYPYLTPPARLHLVYGRQEYLDAARRLAAAQGANVESWRGYANADIKTDNQVLHHRMPQDPVAQAFPDAEILTEFVPPQHGPAVTVTLRPDGSPLDWKLPRPSNTTGSADDSQVANRALALVTGRTSLNYAKVAQGVQAREGLRYLWQWIGSGQDASSIGIEAVIRNKLAWQVKTNFNLPSAVQRELLSIRPLLAGASVLYWIVILLALVLSLRIAGRARLGRALKEKSILRLTTVFAAAAALAVMVGFDDEVLTGLVGAGIFFSYENSVAAKVTLLILASLQAGLLLYLIGAATLLNANWHPARVRGFWLMGTKAFFSRVTGSEILGGWLFAPVFLAVRLAAAAAFHVPLYGGLQNFALLSQWPVINSVMNSLMLDDLYLLALAGVLIPQVLRLSRLKFRSAILPLLLLLAMLNSLKSALPFVSEQVPNMAFAALTGLVWLALYWQFGILGMLAGASFQRILRSAADLLVQPSKSLETSGWWILALFAGLGILALVACVKGPEVSQGLESGLDAADEQSRREKLLEEFNVARLVQQKMLPSSVPELAGYSIAAFCEAALEVGGDLYDFPHLKDGRLAIGVADVSGKGVPAALYMTLTKGLLSAATEDSGDPREILCSVNKHLRVAAKKKMFVTMALGVLNPQTRSVEYVRAGHNPAVWRRAALRETRLLGGGGIGLGIAPPALFKKTLSVESFELSPGDALVFYSDGLTEAMNSELEQFGENRLIAALELADGLPAAATRDLILNQVRHFLQSGRAQDDLTIAVLRVNSLT